MGHWYGTDGEPHHFVAKKDGSGMRPSTIADARKNNWLPSVTSVIDGVLRKPALERWLITQAVTAVTTAPDVPDEGLDAKIERVLNTERQADEEAKFARDKGTAIHAACEAWFKGESVDPELLPWIAPACEAVAKYGKPYAIEKVLVGDGYAGKTDLILKSSVVMPSGNPLTWIFDFKTTKKLPKDGAYMEHQIQASAYVAAAKVPGVVGSANCYISTAEKGAFVIWSHPDWQMCYEKGFLPLLTVWKLMNNWTNGK